jgi:peptidoglycan/xylan/chitin deacetylase (PgdA/CDA1 family)
MHLIKKLNERSKLLLFELFQKKALIKDLTIKSFNNSKILIFFTMDLEYPSKYTKNESYEGFKDYQEILKKNKIPSTFFVCGDFALDHKEDIINLVKAGNEVGSHGYGHTNLGPDIWWKKHFLASVNIETRKKSIMKNHEILSKILKKRPISFRTPYLSIDNATLNILSEAGYKIDSSVNNPLLGMPTIPYNPSRDNILKIGRNDIIEFPITCSLSRNLKFKPLNLDYDRITFFNSNDLSKNIKIIDENKKFSPYIVILTHPWEFSDDFKPGADERLRLLSKFISVLKRKFDVNFLKIENIRSS